MIKDLQSFFKTLQSFANSEQNTFKNDYDDGQGLITSEREEGDKIKQRYEVAYRINTTEEQDEKMKEASKKIVKKGYGLFTNNCTDVPSNALKAGGLKDGETTNHGKTSTKYFGKFTYDTKNFLPSTKQREIEKNNQGKRVDEILKPN